MNNPLPAPEKHGLKNAENWIFVLLALMFLERVVWLARAGVMASGECDDVAYIQSAFRFARDGVLTVWTSAPTAGIMPGLPVLLGVIARLFGEGPAFYTVSKLVLICLGCLEGWFFYRAVRLVLPAPWALFAASALLLPDRAWLDTLISTEPPYLCFFCMNLYYMLKMRRDKSLRCTLLYGLSLTLALLFRANILSFVPFALLWLLLSGTHSPREVAGRALLSFCVVLLFLVPWTLRNYRLYETFIPVSYGAAHPMLEGSYQGASSPKDEELDYETNVEAVVREKYARCFDESGEPRTEALGDYIKAMRNRVKALYRIREWFSRDPGGFLRAYLIDKPLSIQTWVYYWGDRQELVIPPLKLLSRLNFVFCGVGVLLSLLLRQKRRIALLLCAMYWVNIYLIATSYAVERYAALLLPLRYFLGALALWLCVQGLGRVRRKI